MCSSDLIARTTRAARPLFGHGTTTAESGLNETERQKAAGHRELAGRKLKMAKLLGSSGFPEEVRQPLLECLLATARALAVESRMPEPGKLESALLPPIASQLGATGSLLAKVYVETPSTEWQSLAELLENILKPSP